MPFAATIRLLANRWSSAGVLLQGFPLLARGRPVGIDAIAEASGVPVGRVIEALDAGRCARDAGGQLIDLYGLTLSSTLHRLEVGGRISFSCCALWAHVIPRLIEQTVLVESIDPITRRLVRLSVSPEGTESIDPAGSVATMAIANQDDIGADVCAAFCCSVRHFTSMESAEHFATGSPGRHVVSIMELDDCARLLLGAIPTVVNESGR